MNRSTDNQKVREDADVARILPLFPRAIIIFIKDILCKDSVDSDRLSATRYAKGDRIKIVYPRVLLMSFKSGCNSATITHFMSEKLLNSQLDVLEEPANAMSFDVSEPPQVIVQNIRTIVQFHS